MTTTVVTIGPEAPFVDVVDRLLANEISGLPVIDDDGRLLGIVTEADLVSKEAYGYRRRRALGLITHFLRGHDPQWVRKAAGLTARDLMTGAPATATPEDELAVAARRMLEEHHKRLPVVDDDGRLVGIVSRHDLLVPFHRSDEDIATDIETLLADPRRVPGNHAATASVADGVVTLAGTAAFPSDVRVLEAVLASVPGVIAVDIRLEATEPEPRVSELPPRIQ